jgi:hypothetical protein
MVDSSKLDARDVEAEKLQTNAASENEDDSPEDAKEVDDRKTNKEIAPAITVAIPHKQDGGIASEEEVVEVFLWYAYPDDLNELSPTDVSKPKDELQESLPQEKDQDLPPPVNPVPVTEKKDDNGRPSPRKDNMVNEDTLEGGGDDERVSDQKEIDTEKVPITEVEESAESGIIDKKEDDVHDGSAADSGNDGGEHKTVSRQESPASPAKEDEKSQTVDSRHVDINEELREESDQAPSLTNQDDMRESSDNASTDEESKVSAQNNVQEDVVDRSYKLF